MGGGYKNTTLKNTPTTPTIDVISNQHTIRQREFEGVNCYFVFNWDGELHSLQKKNLKICFPD